METLPKASSEPSEYASAARLRRIRVPLSSATGGHDDGEDMVPRTDKRDGSEEARERSQRRAGSHLPPDLGLELPAISLSHEWTRKCPAPLLQWASIGGRSDSGTKGRNEELSTHGIDRRKTGQQRAASEEILPEPIFVAGL